MNFISVNFLFIMIPDKFKSKKTKCFHDFFIIFITGTRFCLVRQTNRPGD